jgi:hypothetical protein
VIAILAAPLSAAPGDPPLKLEDIPVYPEAQRNAAAEAEYRSQSADAEEGESGRSESIRIYIAAAFPESVTRFYIDKLKARQGYPEIDEEPAPGDVIPPFFELEFYDERDFENQHERDLLIYDGKWVKSCLEGREPWTAGQWLRAGNIMWEIRTGDGDRIEYLIAIEDESVDNPKRTFRARTRILIQVVKEEF